MKLSFVPDYYVSKFDDITVDFFKELGIFGIVFDIDNTLEPYENPVPSENLLAWLGSLKNAGIRCSFVSNNGKERVELFNKELGYPAFPKAKKPFKKNVIAAMRAMNTDKNATVLMGDQIFTDVLAAHNAGIKAILVKPIKDKRDLFTRFKRLLEKPILKKYEKRKSK